MSDRDSIESQGQANEPDFLPPGDVLRERLIRMVEHILAAPLPGEDTSDMREWLEELKNEGAIAPKQEDTPRSVCVSRTVDFRKLAEKFFG
jgi:hypothetical protein